MTFQKSISTIIILALFSTCKEVRIDDSKVVSNSVTKKRNTDSLKNKLSENIQFVADSLLFKTAYSLNQTLEKYQFDTCGIIAYEDSALKEEFQGIKFIGDINKNRSIDSVFVLPPFNHCDDGYSYYFTDSTLPRLYTDSYCCHPENLFTIGDIDEDGILEICIFHSSCVSKFKALVAYSLKGNKWQEIGTCGFDINLLKPGKEQRVRKIAKGKFEMLEIIDKEKNKVWKQFSF